MWRSNRMNNVKVGDWVSTGYVVSLNGLHWIDAAVRQDGGTKFKKNV